MMMVNPRGFTNEEFVGYTFQGSPERRHRLWFLDRHLALLFLPWSGLDIDVGTWTVSVPERCREHAQRARKLAPAFSKEEAQMVLRSVPQEVMDRTCPGHLLRYEHRGASPWSAVWELTGTVIPHVHTFGLEDDVWRLGVWPD